MGVITNFVAKKQQISNIIITPTPNNIRYYNFTLKSLPGEVPDQALLLAVGVAGHHQDGHDGPKQ